MLNKLRNINNKLINYYKGNDIEYKKQLKIKRKTSAINNSLVIYSFNSFDDYCEFCKYISLHLNSETYLKLRKVSLSLYNSKYY